MADLEAGRRLSYVYEVVYEVVEFMPGQKLVMRTAQGPFPMETTYVWEPIAGSRTLMTLVNRGAPRGFSRWMSPFMRMAIRRANAKDLRLLKSIIEAS